MAYASVGDKLVWVVQIVRVSCGPMCAHESDCTDRCALSARSVNDLIGSIYEITWWGGGGTYPCPRTPRSPSPPASGSPLENEVVDNSLKLVPSCQKMQSCSVWLVSGKRTLAKGRQ